jgi:hypothetical protein
MMKIIEKMLCGAAYVVGYLICMVMMFCVMTVMKFGIGFVVTALIGK